MEGKRLSKEEILKKFIIEAEYGTPNAFPSGRGSVVVLSEVSCESSDNDCWTVVGIHRNGKHLNHAETKLLQLLQGISDTAQKIDVQLTQNFSPCNLADDENGAECAKNIVDYLKTMEENRKDIKISITFANFYKTEKYYANDRAKAEKNREGLRLLSGSGVKLRLLRGKTKWERLLNNELFVNLTETERDECLKMATSKERKKREDGDRVLLKEYLKTVESRLQGLTVGETSQDQQYW